VERQLKSERMKTELITNVSHDIKTPLTSIVNYVDLLQKPHTPAEGEQYLEVLARQSQRLKKLTEDLVEMSKASSGSIPVNLAPVNVVELVNQALAEYEEKLQRANLPVVLTAPQPEILVSADGRLFWRVMDNLLGNCVKYAQPGTRVYVDVVKYEKKVMISVKNISQAELNLPAEELMERFVRGDSARNTEGSGLGLNIAKTLMSLQKGKLNLVIDGDLFKAVLLFNCLSPTPEENAP
jgi:signal transduction histidine kinase